MARSTWPGPTRRPAVRKVRAKCTIFVASLSPFGRPPRAGSAEAGGSASIASAQWLGGDVGFYLTQDIGRFRPLQALDVILVLEQDAESVVDHPGIEIERIQLRERRRPIDRLGNAWRFEQIQLAQFLDEAHDLARQPLAGARRLHLQDLKL